MQRLLCVLAVAWTGNARSAEPVEGVSNTRLDRWVWAVGGSSTFRSTPSLLIRGRIEVEGQPNPPIRFAFGATGGSQFFVELTHAEHGKIVEVFDGESGWRHSDTLGSGFMLPAETAERLHWDDLYLALRYKELFERHQQLPDQQFEGRWYNVFSMHPRNGVPELWFQDYQSGLLHARVRPASEHSAAVTTIMTDYRKVRDRLHLPFQVTTLTGGLKIVQHRESVTVTSAVKPDSLLPPPAVKARAAAASAILDRYLQASGGPEVASRIKSRITTGKIEDKISGMIHSIKITQLSPHFLLSESESPGLGLSVQGFDGATAWAFSDIEGYKVLKGGELMSLLSNASFVAQAQIHERFPFAFVLDPDAIEGRPAERLRLATWAGPAGVYWFDQATGHMMRVEAEVAAGAQGTVEVTMDFSDFRDVDGVVMPFAITTRNPAMQTKTTILEVQHDVPVDPAIFAPRKDG